jgi:hypothetical protein
MSRAQLVDFAANTATAVANGKVHGFLPAQNISFSNALAAAKAELAAADLAQVEMRALALQATQIAEDKRMAVLKILSEIKFAMRGVSSPAAEYQALGFVPPSQTRSVIMPQRPGELAASGFSFGVNQLRWSGNNASGTVMYIIEARIGPISAYVMIGSATRQSFKHTGVTPGKFYQYRVRAQASRGLVSEWSNEAVVYGM